MHIYEALFTVQYNTKEQWRPPTPLAHWHTVRTVYVICDAAPWCITRTVFAIRRLVSVNTLEEHTLAIQIVKNHELSQACTSTVVER